MDIRKIIREEIKKIMNPQPEVIEIDYDEGSVFGVIHFDREHLKNWEAKERVQPSFDTIPDDELFPIGILKNINVDEEYQGQGFGVDLMENFMTECSHCQYVIFIADLGEEQRKGFNLIDWYKQFGFTIWGESSGNPVMIKKVGDTVVDDILSERYTTNDNNYEFSPTKIWEKINKLKSIGSSLDSNSSDNITNLQVLSTGERAGRLLAEVGYPDGTVVLFYKSMKGTSGKEKGGWFPIPGFINSPANELGLQSGWFVKTKGVDNRYGSKTFQGTADYLQATESSLEEIDLSVSGNTFSTRPKPGLVRKFPEENPEGGHSLNLSVDDGPHQFPEEEDF
jgi:GNAT superfamily N-acetyltransferase